MIEWSEAASSTYHSCYGLHMLLARYGRLTLLTVRLSRQSDRLKRPFDIGERQHCKHNHVSGAMILQCFSPGTAVSHVPPIGEMGKDIRGEQAWRSLQVIDDLLHSHHSPTSRYEGALCGL